MQFLTIRKRSFGSCSQVSNITFLEDRDLGLSSLLDLSSPRLIFLEKPDQSAVMPAPLLIAQESAGHTHLVIGSNPLASARCARSIEVGAKPTIIAPADAAVHYVLMKRIDAGEVEWVKRSFEDADLTTLGRDEVDNVVDAVFVCLGGKAPLST